MRTWLLFCIIYITNVKSLEVLNDWNFMNFNFPPRYNLSFFRPENTIVTGLEITPDRLFIAIPRLRAGVPAVLNWIPRNNVPASNVLLQPYPDWSFHEAGQGNYNCSGLISVYRPRIDSCNRLWVLDAGTVNSLADFRRACNPKILIFDLNTDKLVRSIVFPDDVLRPHSVLTNIVIDETIQGKCDYAFAYISDSLAAGLIVFDAATDNIWRFTDPSFFPNPDYATMEIRGEQFSLMDGIIGLALAPQLGKLYFQALATDRIFSVPTNALIKGPPAEFDQLPVSTAGQKSSQGMALAVNYRDNTLYFCPFTETSVATWNIISNRQEILARDDEALQFVAELKWTDDGYLYIVSSRFHKFFLRTVDSNDTNVRIMRIPLRAARQFNYFPFSNSLYLK